MKPSYIIYVDPQPNDKWPYKRHTGENTDDRKGDRATETGAQVRVMWPQAQACWQPLEAGRDRKQIIPEIPHRNSSFAGFWNSRLHVVRNFFVCG